MKKLSGFFTIASGVFAVIPGIAIMTSNIGVPPNSSRALFGGVIEALGVLMLLLLWTNRERIRHAPVDKINNWAIRAAAVFLLALFTYIFLYNYLVVEVENSESLFFPLWASGELKAGLSGAGGRSELIHQWGRDDVYKVIQGSSRVPLLVTTLIMLFIYQLTFLSLTFAFGVLGIRSSAEEGAGAEEKK